MSLSASLWQLMCIHHASKCMSCHKAIVVIIGRAHCFHDNIYCAHLASVRFEQSVSWNTVSFKEVNLSDIKNCLTLVVKVESVKSITRRQNICH